MLTPMIAMLTTMHSFPDRSRGIRVNSMQAWPDCWGQFEIYYSTSYRG